MGKIKCILFLILKELQNIKKEIQLNNEILYFKSLYDVDGITKDELIEVLREIGIWMK